MRSPCTSPSPPCARRAMPLAREPKVPLVRHIADSKHVIVERDSGLLCLACRQTVSMGACHIVSWLQGHCTPIPTHHDMPMKVCTSGFAVGRQVVHHTHYVCMFKGLLFCSKCGSRGPGKLVHLALPCLPPTSHGLSVLKAISLGRLPPGLRVWPA